MRAWLLRHTPWWVVTILWCVVMLFGSALVLSWITYGVRFAIGAVLDTDLVKAFFAAFYGYIGVLASAWWLKEARHWREISPEGLRPSNPPVPTERPPAVEDAAGT